MPIKTRQKVVEIDGIKTNLFCSFYDNVIFVIIQQSSRIGSMVYSSKIKTTVETKLLLGDRTSVVECVYAKSLVNMTFDKYQKDILLGISLSDKNQDINKILSEIKDLLF